MRRERGYILILSGLSIVAITVLAALVVDVGHWRNITNKAQRAADNAATAAVAELVEVELATGDRAAAETAARTLADELARENGFDPADPDVTVSTTFSKVASVDHATVVITENEIPLFFSQMLIDGKSLTKAAEAAMSSCQASCGQEVVVPPPFTETIDTGVGGDGWVPEISGDYIMSLYHHDSGDMLVCSDRRISALCDPGGNPTFYPVEPYPGMMTNYAPPLEAVGTDFYMVVQQSSTVGLGCWSVATHSRCSGFASPLELAPYEAHGDDSARMRLAGPVDVDGRLFMYGDDNRMHCYDLSTTALCTGYPKATALSGVHDMTISNPSEGFAGGVDHDGGLQFDMAPDGNGRIYTSLTPADGATWLSCWDTSTDATCGGFTAAATSAGRPILFIRYATDGTPAGVCARAANRGGGPGVNHTCFSASGTDVGPVVPWPFDSSGTWKAGQQSATGVTRAGNTVTYFPMRTQSVAKCWDWTIAAECLNPGSNWSGMEDYGYGADGQCVFGLGHTGELWSFGLESGQAPCESGGVVDATITPCACADGVTSRWTAIRLIPTTELSLYQTFTVELRRPDGSLLVSVDFVTDGIDEIDLDFLNDESPPPAFLTLSIDTQVATGMEAALASIGVDQGVTLVNGVRPTLVG